MRQKLGEDRNFHFVHRFEYFLSHFVEIVFLLRDSLKDFVDEVFVVFVQLANSFNLTDNILLSEQLEQPVIALLLHHFYLPDVFHVRIDAYPEHRIIVMLLPEYIFRLLGKTFELELVHFKVHVLVGHDLSSLAGGRVVVSLLVQVELISGVRGVRQRSATATRLVELGQRGLRKDILVSFAALGASYSALKRDVGRDYLFEVL